MNLAEQTGSHVALEKLGIDLLAAPKKLLQKGKDAYKQHQKDTSWRETVKPATKKEHWLERRIRDREDPTNMPPNPYGKPMFNFEEMYRARAADEKLLNRYTKHIEDTPDIHGDEWLDHQRKQRYLQRRLGERMRGKIPDFEFSPLQYNEDEYKRFNQYHNTTDALKKRLRAQQDVVSEAQRTHRKALNREDVLAGGAASAIIGGGVYSAAKGIQKIQKMRAARQAAKNNKQLNLPGVR